MGEFYRAPDLHHAVAGQGGGHGNRFPLSGFFDRKVGRAAVEFFLPGGVGIEEFLQPVVVGVQAAVHRVGLLSLGLECFDSGAADPRFDRSAAP
ncbi:hypothetical protein SDC9_153459 [bioreactor metagenome]|uniref:Uncharacterized protein n=1 Tax=bioreactor metagenome TaxID=1076179 RepID=A0A645F0M2_9ZZZZ